MHAHVGCYIYQGGNVCVCVCGGGGGGGGSGLQTAKNVNFM